MLNSIITLFKGSGAFLEPLNIEETKTKTIYKFYYKNFTSINKLNLIIKTLKEITKAKYQIKFDITSDFILTIELIKNFNTFYFQNYFQNIPKNKNYILLGIDENGAPVYRKIEQLKSCLIVGASGSGKSSFIHQLILSMLLNNNNIYLFLIDLKMVEFNLYNNFVASGRVVERVANDTKTALKMIIKFYLLIKQRFKRMKRQNERFSSEAPAVLIVDEFAQLFTNSKEKRIIQNYIAKIGALGRASNCYLILATQHATNENINNTIRSNLQTRFALKCSNRQQSQNAIQTSEAFDLVGAGELIAHIDGEQPQKIKACFVSDELLNQIKEANKH